MLSAFDREAIIRCFQLEIDGCFGGKNTESLDKWLDAILESCPNDPECQRHANALRENREECLKIMAGMLGLY